MKMKDNPTRRTAFIWAIITALAVFAVFAPHIFGMDEFNGGFAISAISIIVAITGIIVTVIYARRARSLNRILRGQNLLAHWTYSVVEWNQYAEKEYRTEKKEKRVLFYMVAGFALFFGVLAFIFDREAGLWVLISMLVLIALIAFVAWFAAWYDYRQNKKYLGEAYITRDAVYLNRQLHTWHGLGARLESVILTDNESQQVLSFTYSAPTRMGRQENTVRVPVPKGREKAAEKLAEKLNAGIK
jgi:4-amino-4-deoxy-L-arabinose transferase-like glycosyltransferase